MENVLVLPEWLASILSALRTAGFAAYPVGGAVRDLVLGRKPKDFDIVTAARTENIVAVARQSGWTVVEQLGQNFGVVIVVVEGNSVEIAAYRGERYGEDSHRPDEVWYADTLAEDLARRDFTMNAMALAEDGTIIDPFNGQVDLAQGIIRTVGKAERRFAEDALRMFRACRFAAQLGFILEPATAAAIGTQLDRVKGLSLERVRMELERTLTASWPEKGLRELVRSGLAAASCRIKQAGSYTAVAILPELAHLVDLPQNPAYHCYDVWRHTLAVTAFVPDTLTLRWAALLHDVGKGLPGIRGIRENGQPSDHRHEEAGAGIAAAILARFRYPAAFINRVQWLIGQHMHFGFAQSVSHRSVISWIRREARSGSFRYTRDLAEGFRQLGELGLADVRGTGSKEADLEKIAEFGAALCRIAADMPVHTADLHYVLDNLLPVLDDHQYIGTFLKTALQRVQDGQLDNAPDAIRQAAAAWIKRGKAEV